LWPRSGSQRSRLDMVHMLFAWVAFAGFFQPTLCAAPLLNVHPEHRRRTNPGTWTPFQGNLERNPNKRIRIHARRPVAFPSPRRMPSTNCCPCSPHRYLRRLHASSQYFPLEVGPRPAPEREPIPGDAPRFPGQHDFNNHPGGINRGRSPRMQMLLFLLFPRPLHDTTAAPPGVQNARSGILGAYFSDPLRRRHQFTGGRTAKCYNNFCRTRQKRPRLEIARLTNTGSSRTFSPPAETGRTCTSKCANPRLISTKPPGFM